MTETPTNWRKSSYSDSGQMCVELATTSGAAHVRDSKRPEAGCLTLDDASLASFVEAARSGEYDAFI